MRSPIPTANTGTTSGNPTNADASKAIHWQWDDSDTRAYRLKRSGDTYGSIGRSGQTGGGSSHSHGIDPSGSHTHSIPTQGNHTHSHEHRYPRYHALFYIMKL